MIKIDNIVLPSNKQWNAIIMGARNPLNSWLRSDSNYFEQYDVDSCEYSSLVKLGPNDRKLMMSLAKGGPVHAKYRRMITVYMDITAPLYWWKEFDMYKVGSVANSCSTMHKIHEKEFTLEDFSCEHLFDINSLPPYEERTDITHCTSLAAISVSGDWCYYTPKGFMEMTCDTLNYFRDIYLKTKDKKYWWQMIQLLPSSYNQKRTVMLNYEVLYNMYHSRKNHKLDEWVEFCEFITTLPYSEIITLKGVEEKGESNG